MSFNVRWENGDVILNINNKIKDFLFKELVVRKCVLWINRESVGSNGVVGVEKLFDDSGD